MARVDGAAPRRFQDQQVTVWDFTDEILVRCPRCQGCARIVARPGTRDRVTTWTPRRLVCGCGYVADHPPRAVASGPGHRSPQGEVADPYMGLPLWLQATCCTNQVLWAYNLRHLDFLAEFVAAKIRERSPQPRPPQWGSPPLWHQRMTMVAKLPTWLKSAKHRGEILRTIARLRQSAPTPASHPHQS
jgi:hypothetical protein